jgi:hypothetical protein
MFHAPYSGLHLEQKGRIIAFVFLQLSTGISNDAVFSVLFDLRQNGSQASWLFVIAQAGVGDEGVWPISSRVIDYGL